MTKISTLVYQEIEDAKNAETKRGKETFNQHKTLKRINSYLNDQFMERSNDDAIFWNLSTPRIPHFAKNIDLDTKHFYPFAVGETSFMPNWILKMKFYAWCKENAFALTLNDLSTGLATYGSVVIKKCFDEDGEPTLEEVNLENLYFDQTAKSIRGINIVELHYLSETELRAKDDVWENVEKIIEAGKKNAKDNNESLEYEIWERWGQCEVDGKYKQTHYIGYGKGDDEIIALEDENVKDEDFPYFDFHVWKYAGTWLRMGIVERLFNLQVRANQLINQNAQATEIASLLLLRSNDPNMNGNVLKQAENGQIINSTDLQQVALQNPGMSNFINEMNLIERQADKLCFTPEVVSGQSLPSGTPFRGMALMSQAAKSTFEYIQQSVGEQMANILLEHILPEFVKNWNREDLMDITDDEDDIKIYDEAIKTKMKIEAILDGKILTPELSAMIDAKAETDLQKVGRQLNIGKNAFNFEMGIRMNPTGESVDQGRMNDAMNNAIQYVMQNPAIINTPLFKQYLENNGIEWWKLTPEQKQDLANSATGAQANPQMPTADKMTKEALMMGGQ